MLANGWNPLQITVYRTALNIEGELRSNIETDYEVTHSILKNPADSSLFLLQRMNGEDMPPL